jgi:hypothetical protein
MRLTVILRIVAILAAGAFFSCTDKNPATNSPDSTKMADTAVLQAILDSIGLGGVPLDSVARFNAVGRVRVLRLVGGEVAEKNLPAKLEKLPPSIGSLQDLDTLLLQENLLDSLPAEIGNLPHLSSLNLRGNQFVNFPLELGKLTSLRALDFGSNGLTSIPDTIGALVHLDSLSYMTLDSNRICNLDSALTAWASGIQPGWLVMQKCGQ